MEPLGVYLNHERTSIFVMKRLSISFTTPNDNWLNEQLASQEYSSKSEIINELIRMARKQEEELAYIRSKIREGEQSGFTDLTAEEILLLAKKG